MKDVADLTITVMSARVPPGGIQLPDRSATYKAWTGNKVPSHGNDPIEGAICKVGRGRGSKHVGRIVWIDAL